MSDLLVDQSWIQEWQAGTFDRTAAAVAWMRGRPPVIQEMMVKFPPSCIVRANRPLLVPYAGTCGIVTSYSEDGSVSVRQCPKGDVRAFCEPEWLEVVGYWKGLTPEVVKEILR